MAITSPVAWMQNSGLTNTASMMRLADGGSAKGSGALAGLLSGRGGVVRRASGYNLLLSQVGGGNMTVNIEPGLVYVPGTEQLLQGGYWVVNDASLNVGPFTAAHATLNRTDTVYVKVNDSVYSGALNSAQVLIQNGTAGGAAGDISAIPNAFMLGQVTVRAGATSIITSDILNNARIFASPGGVTPTRNDESNEAGCYPSELSVYQSNLRLWDSTNSLWRSLGIPKVSSSSLVWNPQANDVAFLTTGTQFNRYTGSVWQLWQPNTIRFYGEQSGGATIGSGNWTGVALAIERKDTANGHSTVSNTSRYVLPRTGSYRAYGGARWSASSTGSRGAAIRKNGVADFVTGSDTVIPATPGGQTAICTRTIQIDGVAGDYLELVAWQNTGGNLTLDVSTLGVEFLGED